MTRKQRNERKLGNALRAARGHFQMEDGALVPIKQTQTAQALGERILRRMNYCRTKV